MKKVKIDRKLKKPIYRFISGSRLFESKKNAKKYEQTVEYGEDDNNYDEHQPTEQQEWLDYDPDC